MYSNNLGNSVEHLWNKETKNLTSIPTDEILKGCLITHGGKIVNETIESPTMPIEHS